VRRFEAAQHLEVRQVTQDDVNGLGGELREFRASRGQDVFLRGMRVMFDGVQHGQPLYGHPAAEGTQGRSPRLLAAKVFRHDPIESLIMNISQ
jgi:hypothetical protein